jgi:hypothetical protein
MSDIFVLVAAVFVIILILCLVAVKQQQAFNERFPPISDAEFVARCTPGINPQVALRVRRIVADQLGVEYDRIYPSSRFVDDLGAD